jgi:hypothetical protein
MVVHDSFVYLFVYFDNMFNSKYLPSGRQLTMNQPGKGYMDDLISSLGSENM